MPSRRWAVLAAAAVALQLVVLYAPRAPAVPSGGLPLDKLVHLAAFALPTAALIKAGMSRAWAVGLMAAHALISEVVQHALMSGRSGDPADVLADLAGVAAAALVARPGREPPAPPDGSAG